MSTTQTPRSQIISLSDLAWQERQPGVRSKSIWEHSESKRRAVMTRIEPRRQAPAAPARRRRAGLRHRGRHLATSSARSPPGNMGYRPDGCVHTVSAPNGATVLAIITGGVEPLDAAGQRPTVADLHVERPAVDRGASGRAAEADLGGHGRAGAPRDPGAIRAGRHASSASPRGRRADLRRRRGERGRIGPRGHRQHELPAERLRAHRDDEERRHRAGRRVGADGAG